MCTQTRDWWFSKDGLFINRRQWKTIYSVYICGQKDVPTHLQWLRTSYKVLANWLTEGDRKPLQSGGVYDLNRCNFGLVRGISLAVEAQFFQAQITIDVTWCFIHFLIYFYWILNCRSHKTERFYKRELFFNLCLHVDSNVRERHYFTHSPTKDLKQARHFFWGCSFDLLKFDVFFNYIKYCLGFNDVSELHVRLWPNKCIRRMSSKG